MKRVVIHPDAETELEQAAAHYENRREGLGREFRLEFEAALDRLLANPQLSAYSATKFAVLGLSEALRIELKPHGIGVTAICPGVINTAITTASPIRGTGDADARRQRLAATYKKRGYTPERAARNILRAIDRNRAVAPIAAEAHAMYVLSRVAPPLARWVAARMAEVAK